jgi:hypothetical protein
LIQLKVFLLDLNVIAEEKNSQKEGNRENIGYDFKGLFAYPELTGFGIFVGKDKNIKIFFIQGSPLVSSLYGVV